MDNINLQADTSSSFYCGGCYPQKVRPECIGSLKNIGILKVHWESWSECNLSCQFCYRTRGVPLDTSSAKSLIKVVYTGGARAFVFAGGDPSLRNDIEELIEFALQLGLEVEVQTNAHFVRASFANALKRVNLVGLSLDGPDASTHDEFRSKKGNYDRVLRLLAELEASGTPVVIRSVVALTNHAEIPQIPSVLNQFSNIVRWSLLEFSPVGEGFVNQKKFELDKKYFDEATAAAKGKFYDPAKVDIYRSNEKIGTYALVTPGGYLYSTTKNLIDGTYPLVGSLLQNHLSSLLQELPFSMQNHQNRYSMLLQTSDGC